MTAGGWDRLDSAGADMICAFEPDDTRNWVTRINPDRSVTVEGQARVGNPKYRAELFLPQVQDARARAFLTMAENHSGQSPPDGWWDVSYTFPDPDGAIQTVEIWCDFDKMLASKPVRRGS